MMAWISRWLDRLLAVAGAFVFSQVPAFMQQYTQRLGGHLAELQRHLQELQRLAAASGKSLPQYIAKFANNPDPDFARQGELMQGLVHRYHQLSDSAQQLAQASPLMRPIVFVQHVQADIAKGTFDSFQAAFAFSLEGLLYACAGMMCGYLVYSLIVRFINTVSWIFRRPKAI